MSSNIKSIAKRVDELKDDIKEKTEDALDSSMKNVERQMRWNLYRKDAVATKYLINSIEMDRTNVLDVDEVEFADIYATRRIGSSADYWKYVEFGTGIYTGRDYKHSGIPPYLPIYRWVVAKGISPRPGSDLTTQAEVARAIQMSMANSRGIRGQPFARPAWRAPTGKRNVVDSIGDALQDAVSSF